MSKRIIIDADECVACESCVEICPEVFQLEEGADVVIIIKETGGPEDLIQEAIDTCPVQCLAWEE